MRNWDVLTLDPTGKTIPKTYHAPQDPDGVVFMATNGSDSNDGRSETRPVKTLNKAIDLCPNNGTVSIRGGTYNDNYRNADGTYKIVGNKHFTMEAYLGEPVTFDGGGKLRHLMVCGSSIGAGMKAFRGFRITGFAGGWEGKLGDVPLYLGDGNGAWYVIEDMLIDHNQGCGVNLSDPRGDLGDPRVVRCVFADNGSVGLTDTGNMTRKPGTNPTSTHENDLWVAHNYFGRNNKNNNQYAYEAGAKLHNNAKITVFGNIVEDTIGNYGHGLWTDVANRDAHYLCNFVRRCGSDGLFDETGSPTAWFVSNVVVDCGVVTNHAGIRIASQGPKVWYNTSVTTGQTVTLGNASGKGYMPIEIYDDVRNIQTDGYSPDTKDVTLSSNLFVGPGKYNFLMWLYSNQPFHAGGGTWPTDFWKNGVWSKNAWWSPSGNMVRWTESGSNTQYARPADVQKARGVGGSDIWLPGDPFVDRKAWRVKSSSPAYSVGDGLPADIATALGYKPGQQFPRGYIDCPIPTW